MERESHSWADIDLVDDDIRPMPTTEIDPWRPIEFDTRTAVPDSPLRELENVEAINQGPWNVDDLIDEDLDGLYDPWPEEDVPILVEPDPTVDATSDLSEVLYPPDNTVTDISRELKIGELLDRVVPKTESQHIRCYELLNATTVGRLRRLIPWLQSRAWSGAKLQLFPEFRIHWELPRNMRWWETFRWSDIEGTWIPRYTKATLTFDHAIALVERRGQCAPTDVIDRSWFEDWDNCAAWEAGIRSFANFAVFRAEVPNGQDWRELLLRQDQRSAFEIEQCKDGTFAPFMLPSLIAQYRCPRTLDGISDLFPDLIDLAFRTAASLGGDRARAWQEVMAHFERS